MSLLRRFSGGVGLGTVSITNHTISGLDEAFEDPPRCTCSFTLGNNGIASYQIITLISDNSDSGNYLNEWLIGYRGRPNQFSARATTVSQANAGAPVTEGHFSGTTGSWLSLSTSRTWSAISRATEIAQTGYAYWEFTIEIARTADTSTVLDSATITIVSTSEYGSAEPL